MELTKSVLTTNGRGDTEARRSRLVGIATMVGSGSSNQVGAALGAHAFGAIGPIGVVAIRQVVAAVVLLCVARPRLRRLTWSQWWPSLLLAAVLAVMNLSLYTAIGRVGLALAVTLEFLGPLMVALVGSRTLLDLLCAAAAGVGVYVLVLPGPTSDYVGLAYALAAAGCWASYILLNRVLGTRLMGLQAPAVATMVSAVAYLPALVGLALNGRLWGAPLWFGVAAGLLASVVPYACDLVALRRVPARFFGVFMSINPVLAALSGIVLLHQILAPHQWLGISLVVLVNVVASFSTGSSRPRRAARWH